MELERVSMRIYINHQPYVELRRDEVMARVRRIWKSAGRPPGRAREFWLQAVTELLEESKPHPLK